MMISRIITTKNKQARAKFSWQNLARPIVALAPMADMTDSAFCLLAKKFGWPVVFREMISSEAVVRASARTLGMAKFYAAERPVIQQIFGSDPAAMAAAAEIIVEKFAPEGIDINMGCPVHKLVSNFNGAALLRDPDLAALIVKKIKQRVNVPVSVKIRLGWSEKTECLVVAQKLEDAGADLLSVHGRTRAQGYSGVADWKMMRRVKQVVSIPVLCNGDINLSEKIPAALEISGCDGVLIGRGALGCPWFYQQYSKYVQQGRAVPAVTLAERVAVVRQHARLHRAQYGQHSVMTFRKHLVWYFKGVPQIKSWRLALVQAATWQDLDLILTCLLSDTEKILNDSAAHQFLSAPNLEVANND